MKANLNKFGPRLDKIRLSSLSQYHTPQSLISSSVQPQTPQLKMPFNTALTRKLGIKSMQPPAQCSFGALLMVCVVPVVQGGMQWVGYAELASAVSNAGGLGIVRCPPCPLPRDIPSRPAPCQFLYIPSEDNR